VQTCALPISLAALPPSLLIYPPTGSQWRPRAGGLWGGFPDPAKLICMAFAKNGFASSHTRGAADAAPTACLRRPPHAGTRAAYPRSEEPRVGKGGGGQDGGH